MSENAQTVLDHIDNIVVPGNPFAKPANEYWAMVCLRNGLECLYHQVKRLEDARKPEGEEAKYWTFSYGDSMGLAPEHLAVLTSMFHWYAVTACNYARLVGAVAYRQDNSRPMPPLYVKSVMPEIATFRDKVAAHFAWTSKNSNDNDAERMSSVFPQVTWENDCFMVCSLTTLHMQGSKVSDSSALKAWSITAAHEELRRRFWQEPSTDSEPEDS